MESPLSHPYCDEFSPVAVSQSHSSDVGDPGAWSQDNSFVETGCPHVGPSPSATKGEGWDSKRGGQMTQPRIIADQIAGLIDEAGESI